MSIIQDVLAAPRGGMKERDDKIASLKVERDGYKTDNHAMASDLQHHMMGYVAGLIVGSAWD